MRNRAEALSLLAELRGRLDELEQLIAYGPDFALLPAPSASAGTSAGTFAGTSVPAPAASDDPGVETLTPAEYLAFRAQEASLETSQEAASGISPPETRKPYKPFHNFLQFGAPGADIAVSFESFALSDLHRAAGTRAQGVRLVPQGAPQKWFTYEFLAEAIDFSQWDWVEFVLKISLDEPDRLHPQFILNTGGKPERVSLGECPMTKFATFVTFRLDRKKLTTPPQSPTRIRLALATAGGQALPLTLYQFGLYGKRLAPKE